MSRSAPTPQPWLELRTLRERSGLSPRQLHLLAGIAEGHLSDLEHGNRKPTPVVLAKLAKALAVPVAVLIPREQPLPAEVLQAVAAEGEAVA
jgi:transcriptional regulator with XRE-family HTH domain